MKRFIAIAAITLAAATAALAQAPSTQVAERGQAAFKNQGCYGCHLIGKFGTPIGPDLSHVGSKYQEDYLARWLRDPALQRPNAHMPKLELTDADVKALAAYLGSLR